jgi:hypothetical protein
MAFLMGCFVADLTAGAGLPHSGFISWVSGHGSKPSQTCEWIESKPQSDIYSILLKGNVSATVWKAGNPFREPLSNNSQLWRMLTLVGSSLGTRSRTPLSGGIGIRKLPRGSEGCLGVCLFILCCQSLHKLGCDSVTCSALCPPPAPKSLVHFTLRNWISAGVLHLPPPGFCQLARILLLSLAVKSSCSLSSVCVAFPCDLLIVLRRISMANPLILKYYWQGCNVFNTCW